MGSQFKTIRVERAAIYVPGGLQIGRPKSAAGLRTVAIPPHLTEALERHLREFVGPEPDAPLLAGPRGGRVRPQTLQNSWEVARKALSRPEVHFHDLRHAGATWLAISGATTKEIMARVGHSSPNAALRYQHATEDRDTAVANALSGLAEDAKVINYKFKSDAGNLRDRVI